MCDDLQGMDYDSDGCQGREGAEENRESGAEKLAEAHRSDHADGKPIRGGLTAAIS